MPSLERTFRRALAIVIALLAGAAGAPAGGDDADPAAEIVAASRAFSAAYVDNDTAALAEIYTDEALLLPPGRVIRGRAAAAEYFRWGPRHRQIAHAMESEELLVRGDVAVDVGTWTSTFQRGDSPPATASGTYLVVWMRERDGRWRMRYDMWHRPAPAPE